MSQKQPFSKFRIISGSIFIIGLLGSIVLSLINSRLEEWGNKMIDDYILSHSGEFLSWILKSPLNLVSAISLFGLAIIVADILFQARKVVVAKEKMLSNERRLLEPEISILPSQDELVGNHIFKQIQIISSSNEKLLSCFANVMSFCKILSNEKKDNIAPRTNELIWAASVSGIERNRLNLTIGIPARLYIARINIPENRAELAGIYGRYTQIDKGNYFVQIRIDGENFSPQTFSLSFYYDGKKSIKFKDFSKASKIEFFVSEIDIGKYALSVKPKLIRKK